MAGNAQREVKDVLITGATSGIGNAMAIKLVEAGANVYVTGRDESKLQTVVTALRTIAQGGQTIEYICFDMCRLSSVRSKMTDICAVRYDTVIFNAGTMFPNPADADMVDLPALEDTLKVNVLGHLLIARKLLHANGPGNTRFVCLSSVTAELAAKFNRWPSDAQAFHSFFSRERFFSDGWWSYFDSKLAVIVMSQWLIREGAGAVAIHPGVASTKIVDRIPWYHKAMFKVVFFPFLQKMETPDECATRVIDKTVVSSRCVDTFQGSWFCKGQDQEPIPPLTVEQKDAFMQFAIGVTDDFMQ